MSALRGDLGKQRARQHTATIIFHIVKKYCTGIMHRTPKCVSSYRILMSAVSIELNLYAESVYTSTFLIYKTQTLTKSTLFSVSFNSLCLMQLYLWFHLEWEQERWRGAVKQMSINNRRQMCLRIRHVTDVQNNVPKCPHKLHILQLLNLCVCAREGCSITYVASAC